MERKKRILILAGGGGHTAFGYALAQRLEGKAFMFFLVPEKDTLSYNRLKRFGEIDYLPKPRGAKTPTIELPYNIIRTFKMSLKKVKNGFDVVVCTGSNFCLSPAIIAFLKRIPIVNIEGEARFIGASKTARILQPLSTITALQWNEQKRFLKGTVVGPLIPKIETQSWNGGYILITGGSLGHKPLFDALNKSNLTNVIMQTGEVDPEQYRKQHPDWKVIRSTLKFHKLIAGAEVVITHQGSTPLEALVYKKPSIIIPNPELKRTFPKKDSEIFAKKIGAIFLSEINLEKLLNAIERAKKTKIPALRDGAKVLADIIMNL